MPNRSTTRAARIRRHRRVRRKLRGTAERPRLAVYRSNQHIYAQVIDDDSGRTLVAASDLDGDLRDVKQTKRAHAEAVGRRIAERAKAAGLESVVFDRGGFKYAGRVQALASAARDEGLVF